MALTQEQIDFFTVNGYLRIGKIIDDAQIEVLRREYMVEFEKAWADNSYRNLAHGDAKTTEEKRRADKLMYQIMQVSERNIHFHKLLYHAPLLDIIADLIGPNIQLFHDQMLYKPAHHGGAVFWHQDNAYWRCRPASLVSCWLTLDDAREANGAMQVIPGSHLRPTWHDTATSTNALLEVKPENVEQRQVVELKAGECMIHHCQTLHYTQPNETADQRRAFIMHYMAPGTVNNHGAMPVGFSRPLLRAAIC